MTWEKENPVTPVRLPKSVKDAIKTIVATKEGGSVSAYIKEAVIEKLKRDAIKEVTP